MADHRRRRRRRSSLWILTALFAAVFVVSGSLAAAQIMEERREAKLFAELSQKVNEPTPEPPSDTQEPAPDLPQTAPAEAPPPDDGQQAPEPQPEFTKYDALKAENPDLFGWVTVDGTRIDYPVMYTPEDPEKYLHSSFTGKKSSSGVPFMDGACQQGCGNYIIYGHHMKNGTMFADLLKYEDRDFWQAHPTIRFDTVDEPGTYEVVAAFYSRAYYVDERDVFRYYQYIDLTVEPVFDDYVSNIKSSSLYDTGLTPVFGDQLLTLSTCSYNEENGRFVVVARRIDEETE